MKTIILAGGRGTRLAEETEIRPKPMVEIGGLPILWHIMKIYAQYGHKDFVVALGYKGEIIKEYFAQYHRLSRDMTIDLGAGTVDVEDSSKEDWRIELIDTGKWTQTGGRVLRLRDRIGDERFMFTWGDGVSDVDISALLEFHESHGKIATVTAVRPPARFGRLDIVDSQIVEYSEKPQIDQGWINGGFFVLEPEVFDYIDGDDQQFERTPLERLAKDGEFMAFQHEGFWQCMDTLREKMLLQRLWESDSPPWKTW
ncbi:MAG: glucose-1-phosphate cytidylyltransferase [Acidimicrobiia bacterium]|nr:glucose-1-phosphate cytidylyltransferase [Acidimicrobiia bacterium]